MKIRILLATLALMGLGAPAAASDIGFYVGGSVGQATKDSDRNEFALFADDLQFIFGFTPASDSRSFDDSDTSFVLMVGYRLTRHLALEGAYSRLGTVSHRSRASGNFPLDAGTLDSTIENETTGFTIAAVGFLPLNRDWEVFGRIGALFADNEISVSIAAIGETFVGPGGQRLSDSGSQTSTDYFAGLGVTRRIFEIYDLRLEYQRFLDVGTTDTGGVGDIDTLMLGLNATF